MSTITITFKDTNAGAEQFFTDQYASLSIDGDGGLAHWVRTVRAAMTAAGFEPETIDDLFLTEAENISDAETRIPTFVHPSLLPDLLHPVDEEDLCECCPRELLKGTLMGFSMYTHPDKVVEDLHGEDIAQRAPRTPDPEVA